MLHARVGRRSPPSGRCRGGEAGGGGAGGGGAGGAGGARVRRDAGGPEWTSSTRTDVGGAQVRAYGQLSKLNLEKWAQPIGGLNLQRAFRSEIKQWLWDLRPSICNFANWKYEN